MSDTTKVKSAPTWQEVLHKSATLFERSGKARKQASVLLWDGAQSAITSWLGEDGDEAGEALYASLIADDALGESRKGDASKIKTVALAAKSNGLDVEQFDNLSKAYAEARRLTQTVKQHAEEDEAAEQAISAIDAPKTASGPEAAAKIVLAKGLDEAARLLLDALGDQNHAAHKAFLRAVAQEVAGRVKPAPKPEPKAEDKGEAKVAKKATSTKAKATVKSGAKKGKPAAKTAPETAEVPSQVESIEGEPAAEPADKPVIKKKAKPVAVRRG